jgi:hypothetical protein
MGFFHFSLITCLKKNPAVYPFFWLSQGLETKGQRLSYTIVYSIAFAPACTFTSAVTMLSNHCKTYDTPRQHCLAQIQTINSMQPYVQTYNSCNNKDRRNKEAGTGMMYEVLRLFCALSSAKLKRLFRYL